MRKGMDCLGLGVSFTAIGFAMGRYSGGTLVEDRYQRAMQEVDKSFRAALGWQAPKDLETCRDMLTAIVLSSEATLPREPVKVD